MKTRFKIIFSEVEKFTTEDEASLSLMEEIQDIQQESDEIKELLKFAEELDDQEPKFYSVT